MKIIFTLIYLLGSCAKISNCKFYEHKGVLTENFVSKIADLSKQEQDFNELFKDIYSEIQKSLIDKNVETSFNNGRSIFMEIVTIAVQSDYYNTLDENLSNLFKNLITEHPEIKPILSKSLLYTDIENGYNILHLILNHDLEKLGVTIFEMELDNFDTALVQTNNLDERRRSPLAIAIDKRQAYFFEKVALISTDSSALKPQQNIARIRKLHQTPLDQLCNNTLILAAHANWTPIIKQLIDNSHPIWNRILPIHYKNKYNANVLHELVARNAPIPLITIVLATGEFNGDDVAMHLASQSGNKEVVGLLYAAGLDYEHTSENWEKVKTILTILAIAGAELAGTAIDRFLIPTAAATANPARTAVSTFVNRWESSRKDNIDNKQQNILDSNFIANAISDHNWIQHVKTLYGSKKKTSIFFIPQKIKDRVSTLLSNINGCLIEESENLKKKIKEVISLNVFKGLEYQEMPELSFLHEEDTILLTGTNPCKKIKAQNINEYADIIGYHIDNLVVKLGVVKDKIYQINQYLNK